MEKIKLYTIGFTKKNAEIFFNLLKENKIERLIDVRLNNVSQLAGFAKKNDLKYFLKELCHVDYIHMPEFAPSEEILKDYKKGKINWPIYIEKFEILMRQRKIENMIKYDSLNDACLLCSEHTAENCHRRLVAEYLRNKFGDIEIIHL